MGWLQWLYTCAVNRSLRIIKALQNCQLISFFAIHSYEIYSVFTIFHMFVVLEDLFRRADDDASDKEFGDSRWSSLTMQNTALANAFV